MKDKKVLLFGLSKSRRNMVLEKLKNKSVSWKDQKRKLFRYSITRLKFKGSEDDFFLWNMNGKPFYLSLWKNAPIYFMEAQEIIFIINLNELDSSLNYLKMVLQAPEASDILYTILLHDENNHQLDDYKLKVQDIISSLNDGIKSQVAMVNLNEFDIINLEQKTSILLQK